MRYANLAFLLLILLTATFKNGVGYISFKLNQEYIAKNLCIQKEVENNCCQGKCHLTSQITKTAETNQTEAPVQQKTPEIQYYFIAKQANHLLKAEANTLITVIYTHILKGYSSPIFHPPK